jgi:uncharacterized protein
MIRKVLGKLLLGVALALAALAFALVVFHGRIGPAADRLAASRFPPLHLAARRGDTAAVVHLLGSGPPGVTPTAIDEQDAGPNGWTPLLHAIHKGQLPVVQLLLARGADPNREAANGTTPLNLAASQGELAIVRTLIAAGARVEGADGARAFLNAAANGHTRVARQLFAAAPGLRVEPGARLWLALLRARLSGDRALLALLWRAERRS